MTDANTNRSAATRVAPAGLRQLTLGHSPDADDAFMFYALAKGLLETGDRRYEHVLQDIQTLNERAVRAELDITAVSIHAFAGLTSTYALLSSGASFGDNYGPLLVSARPMSLQTAARKQVAIPGTMTSAFLALRLAAGEFDYKILPFDEIIPAVQDGRAEVGLLIHEGQLTYAAKGLHKVVDLGEWWCERTGGLPLPLGGNAIRRDLGDVLMRQVSRDLRSAIRFALDHRRDAVDHSLVYAREIAGDVALADRFVGMYVNDLTLDYGERGREAVRRFLGEAHRRGFIKDAPNVEFID